MIHRTLLGNLEPVARLGMMHVLADSGLEVIGEADRPEELVEEARRLQPDAIVLGDGDGHAALRERMRAAAPAAKLIVWARDESEMHVFDPGSAVPRRVEAGVSDALLRELTAGAASGGRE